MADQTTRLIEADDFAPYFTLSDYENGKINIYILKAQMADLRPIIDNTTVSGGDTLYTRLQDYIEASKTPIDTDFDNLLLRITPYLVSRAMKRFYTESNIYATNMGNRILKEENSDPVPDARLGGMADQAAADGNFFEKDLREYLCLNATTYLWSEGSASKLNTTPNIGKIGYKKIKRD